MPEKNPNVLADLLKALENLPSLPQVVLRVNAMVQDPKTQTRDLSRIIEMDVALVARILKLVNSAFFGLRSQVGNIPDAVSTLGFDILHRITLSLSVINAMGRLRQNPGHWLWPHAIRTAVFCEYLARKSGLCRSDDAFVAGLLHDIGLMLLARCMPELFIRLEKAAKEQQKPFFVLESTLTPGFSHATLGAVMADRWFLPPSLGEAIAHHHRFPEDREASNLTLLVHVANVLDNHWEFFENDSIPFAVMHPRAQEKLESILRNPGQWFPPLLQHGREACKTFLGESP